jgi:hypothetical protein
MPELIPQPIVWSRGARAHIQYEKERCITKLSWQIDQHKLRIYQLKEQLAQGFKVKVWYMLKDVIHEHNEAKAWLEFHQDKYDRLLERDKELALKFDGGGGGGCRSE